MCVRERERASLLFYFLCAVKHVLTDIQSHVISTSLISNNRLSRSENLVSVLTQSSTNRQQNIVEKEEKEKILLFSTIFSIYL